MEEEKKCDARHEAPAKYSKEGRKEGSEKYVRRKETFPADKEGGARRGPEMPASASVM